MITSVNPIVRKQMTHVRMRHCLVYCVTTETGNMASSATRRTAASGATAETDFPRSRFVPRAIAYNITYTPRNTAQLLDDRSDVVLLYPVQ